MTRRSSATPKRKSSKKSDRDVWDLGAEILETLLDKTGFEKERDRRPHSVLVDDRHRQLFWSQTTADQLALEVGFCERSISAAARRWARSRVRRRRSMPACATVALCLFADTQGGRTTSACAHYHREWTVPLGLHRTTRRLRPAQRAYEHQFGLDYAALGKLAVAQRGHAVLNDLPWRNCASRSPSTTTSTRA